MANNIIEIRKFESKLKVLLSEIFLNELDEKIASEISISDVIVSGDKHIAKIYLSFSSTKNNDLLNHVRKKSALITRVLSKKITNRRVPRLEFYNDNLLSKINNIDEILYNLKNKKEEK